MLALYLLIPLILGVVYGEESNIIKLFPTDDTYVVSNLNDPSDELGLNDLHQGDEDHIKIWYSWEFTENAKEQIISMGYMKFDLSEVKAEDVVKANFKMNAYIVNLSEASRLLELFPVLDNSWTEQELAFSNRPVPSSQVITSTSISEPSWVSWDLTDFVKENAGTETSFAIFYEARYKGNQENIAFYSKETTDKANAPYLEIELTNTPIDSTLAAIVGGVLVGGIIGGIIVYWMLRKSGSRVVTESSKKNKIESRPETKSTEERKCKLCGKAFSENLKVCPHCRYRV